MSQNENTKEKELQRGLTNRHIQLIALGGAIGTGLFLGIGSATALAGPSVIIGYALAGIIAFFIMRQLGEMIVEEPVSGSFSHFAYKYWGSFAGFASGWNYWMLYVLVSMSELTAIGIYVQFWWPEIPLWASSLFFFVIISVLNLGSVKLFGEAEFWFSIIKVIALISFILFGSYLLFSGTGGEQATIQNLWNNGGVFPKGLISGNSEKGYEGLLAAMAMIMFAFGGLELIGITAAEAKNPEKTIPKATNQVIYRILIFYVGALVVLFSLMHWPWNSATGNNHDISPFVMAFNNMKGLNVEIFGTSIDISRLIANLFNIVILTAALSVYNSSVYSNSRMLYGLAEQGKAPKFLKKLNKNHAPVNTIIVSIVLTGLAIVINFFIPKSSFELLVYLVVACLVINWFLISITHLKFRQQKRKDQTKTLFPSFLYPISNYICLIFLFGILVIMWFTGLKISVELIPVWLIFLYIAYLVVKANKKKSS